MRGTLYLVHVADSDSFDDGFPHVRQALGLWNLMNEKESPAAVGKLGIKVSKVGLESETPLSGLLEVLDDHRTDLIVIATHGRDGIDDLLHGPIAEELSAERKWRIFSYRRLLAVSSIVLSSIRAFVRTMIERDATIELMHVGETGPKIIEDGAVVPVALQTGDPVTAILATPKQVDLIAMPTKGHRGSTTERVVRHSPCPLLAIPAKSD